MSDIEINQFIDPDGGGTLSSWYAEGHHEPEEFALALCEHIIDYGDDVPAVGIECIETKYMRKVPNLDGGWTASFTDKPGRGAMPVMTYDAERQRGGLSCAVRDCDRIVYLRTPVTAVLSVEAKENFQVEVPLCAKHRRDVPDPYYRVFLVPVGAKIVLPKEASL